MVKRRESLTDVTVINSNLDTLLGAENPIALHPPEFQGAITLNKRGVSDSDKITLLVGPTEPDQVSFWREDGEALQIYDADAARNRRIALAQPIGRLTMTREQNLWVARLDGNDVINRTGIINFVNMASFRARFKMNDRD